jgi:hypothetical protein
VVFSHAICYAQTVQITVTIPDELATQIQAQGFALETYIQDLMVEKLSQEQGTTDQRRKAVEAMLQFAGKHGFTTAGQDLKSMVHEGHKY